MLAFRVRWWLYRLGLLVALMCASPRALAGDDTLPLTLIAEATYSERDHVAILHVLQKRARKQGVTLSEMARRYSAVWRRPSVPYRVTSAVSMHPRKYRALLRTISAHRRGLTRNPCPGADHWGAPYGADLERARRAGWRRIDCGTVNAFWSLR